jgi:hypothetical protein
MNKIESDLIVYGYDCSAEEITAMMGVIPSKVITKGDIKREAIEGNRPPLLHDKNVWLLSAGLPKELELYKYIDEAIEWAKSYEDGIRRVAQEFTVELSIYGFADEEQSRMALHLSKEQNRAIAHLGIDVDIDIYPLTNYLLDSDIKKEALVNRLTTLKVFDADKNEIRAFVKTLAAYESESEHIAGALNDFSWSALDRHGLEERIVQIVKSIGIIHQARSESKIFRPHDTNDMKMTLHIDKS